MHCFTLLKVFVKSLFFILKIIYNFVGFTFDIDFNVSLIKKKQYAKCFAWREMLNKKFCLKNKEIKNWLEATKLY